MTTDDGLKGLTDEQWYMLYQTLAFNMDDSNGKYASMKAMSAAARQWLAANVHDSGDAARLNWLACGGWEVMQDPDMWPPNLNFRESIDYGIEFVRADAAILAEKGEV